MIAVIICNGEIKDYNFCKKYIDQGDLIIYVDGGAAHLKGLDIEPHVLLGDFDSISGQELRKLEDRGVEVCRFPAEKDMTDSELAIEAAIERGATEVILVGCMGNRMDHTLANVFLLKKLLDRGIPAVVADELNEIRLVKDHIRLKRDEGYKVSLLPFSEQAEGVTTRGLYYKLENATLETGSTWGISNEFIADTALVTLKKGLLLVIKSRDAD